MGASRSMRIATLLVVAMLSAFTIGACGGNSGGGSGAPSSGRPSKPSGTIKIGAALIGPKNDKSFDQAAYEGIEQALGRFPQLKLSGLLENRASDQQRADAVQTLGPVDKLVVTVSSSFGSVLDEVASQFPKTYFLDVSGYTQRYHDNVTGFANDWGAMLYVAGVVAAKLTKTGTVGFVGGAEIPATTQAEAGFVAGARSVSPKIKVLKNIVGDFNDAAKAKSATSAMIADGADAIFPFLNGGLPGAYAAGTSSGKNPALFSEVIPNCNAYPNMVGTNYVDSKAFTVRLLTDYIHGKLRPGAIFLGLQDPKLQTLQLCPKYQRDKPIAQVTRRTIAAINAGKIKLPAAAVNPRPNYPYREGFAGRIVTRGR